MSVGSPAMNQPTSLTEVLNVLPECWEQNTANTPGGRGYDDWQFDPSNPAQFQCLSTSLLIREWFGGRLITANVGSYSYSQIKHYWNELEGRVWVDATRDQFELRSAMRGFRYAKAEETDFNDSWRTKENLKRKVKNELGL